jgi:voltage-gated potassium channel
MANDKNSKKKADKQFRQKFLSAFLQLLRVTSPIWGVLVVFIALLGLVFSLIEKIRIFEGIYHAFITALTIGYGDITAHTRLGMAISVLIGIIGMVTSGIIVALAFQAVKIAYESNYGKDLNKYFDTDKN